MKQAKDALSRLIRYLWDSTNFLSIKVPLVKLNISILRLVNAKEV